MNNPYSGGWRFGDRPTSVEALYQGNSGISPDFLKQVAALAQDPSKQGLLDQAVTATPLQGLIDAPGSTGWGREVDQTGGLQAGGGYSTSPGGNQMKEVSPAGMSMSLNPNAKSAAGFMSGGLLGALMGSVQMQKLAPVYDLLVPGMNGYMGGDYGTSSTLNGAPNEAQAKAIADSFAAQMAADGYGGYGASAGDSFGGMGGFGAGDYGDGTDR